MLLLGRYIHNGIMVLLRNKGLYHVDAIINWENEQKVLYR